jgi:hypothetical protein
VALRILNLLPELFKSNFNISIAASTNTSSSVKLYHTIRAATIKILKGAFSGEQILHSKKIQGADPKSQLLVLF